MPARDPVHAAAICAVMTATQQGDPAAIAAARIHLARVKLDMQIAKLAEQAHLLAPQQLQRLADLAAGQRLRPVEQVAA